MKQNYKNIIEFALANKKGRKSLYDAFPWLQYLLNTKEANINLENVHALSNVNSKSVLAYVLRTLEELERCKETVKELKPELVELIETTLVWSEVAKCGSTSKRKQWVRDGINLYAHNIGSADIYLSHLSIPDGISHIIYTLIQTHGLIGQYIRGEVELKENIALTKLLQQHVLSKADFITLLTVLNRCIISGVSPALWLSVANEVSQVIQLIANDEYLIQHEHQLQERLARLRSQSIKNGENFDAEFDKVLSDAQVRNAIEATLNNSSLWYIEPALQDFSFEQFIKVILLCYPIASIEGARHLDFSPLMKELYYDYDGVKKVNLFKKRIFEKYLSEQTFQALLNYNYSSNVHVKHVLFNINESPQTFTFNFQLSTVTEKLVEFCIEAEKAEHHFEKAILLLYDYFGLRRDQFDRFHNETDYLNAMNQNIDTKRVILDYIVGEKIVDIGPGGGALLDEIVSRYPTINAIGIDFSKNVVETLEKRKKVEALKWDVIYGNALELDRYLTSKVDTIIFCSIIHELYSYIQWNGKKFNTDVIATALLSAFNCLEKGGRIIIRDGIMSEPTNTKRIIRFKSSEGIAFLKRYAHDFKGRSIQYEIIGQNEVLMPINDAMEMLYTYTWGEQSYVHEVQEQFGYFTPSEYLSFIQETLGSQANVIVAKHYLQEGYAIALSPKIDFFDENYNTVSLPDSTTLIVIEKLI